MTERRQHPEPADVAGRRPREVLVPTPAGAPMAVDPTRRRADVVRRLLANGVSTHTLCTVLPDWSALIRHVATEIGHDRMVGRGA